MIMFGVVSSAVPSVVAAALAQSTVLPAAACPVAPPGAQAYANQLLGYVLWGVISLFTLGIVVGIGAIVGGRVFAMPHASRGGVVGVAMVFLAILGYLVLPGIAAAMTGSGCV